MTLRVPKHVGVRFAGEQRRDALELGVQGFRGQVVTTATAQRLRYPYLAAVLATAKLWLDELLCIPSTSSSRL